MKSNFSQIFSNGLAQIKLPTTLFVNGGTTADSAKATNAVDQLINMLTVQKANELAGITTTPTQTVVPSKTK